MAQKTKTINGQRITAKQVEKQMTEENKLESGIYLVTLAGERFGADHYFNTDAWYIPDDIAPDGVWIEDQSGKKTYLNY